MSLMLFTTCIIAATVMQIYTPNPIEPQYKDVMRKVLVYAHHIAKDIDTRDQS